MHRGRAESQFRVNARMQNILIDPIDVVILFGLNRRRDCQLA